MSFWSVRRTQSFFFWPKLNYKYCRPQSSFTKMNHEVAFMFVTGIHFFISLLSPGLPVNWQSWNSNFIHPPLTRFHLFKIHLRFKSWRILSISKDFAWPQPLGEKRCGEWNANSLSSLPFPLSGTHVTGRYIINNPARYVLGNSGSLVLLPACSVL